VAASEGDTPSTSVVGCGTGFNGRRRGPWRRERMAERRAGYHACALGARSEKSRRYIILGRGWDPEEPDEGTCALMIDSKKCLSSDWPMGAFLPEDEEDEADVDWEAGANGLGAFRKRNARMGTATADTLPNVTRWMSVSESSSSRSSSSESGSSETGRELEEAVEGK
jgi:hypothetical protein